MDSRETFKLEDYIIFLSMIIISAIIGFYFAWKDRKTYNIDEYLLGNRKLKILPVAMSQLASFTSAVSLLGYAHEMYRFGSQYWLYGLSYFITQPFSAHVYLPFFHRLKLTSAYEYLELRFDRKVRILASIIFCIQIIFYMSIVLYAPSLAINQVTGLSLWISVFLTGIICTIYTSIGGIKAVVWTDTFQVVIMFAGLFTIIYEGIRQTGGLDVIFKRAFDSDRIEFFDFDVNPLKRHTFWSIMIGGFFTSLTVYGSNQATIQRYLAVPTIRDAIISMYLNLFGTFAILCVCCFCGFIAFAFYYDCDPLLNGRIKKYDQILPLLVIDLLRNIPGLSGLFIASIYAACLSTISSGLNSLATVCLKDFVQPLYLIKKNKIMTEKLATSVTKSIAAFFGFLIIFLSFLCNYFGSTVVQIAQSTFGIMGGPLLGVISLGMFVPFANSNGAFYGLIISLLVNFFLSICSTIFARPLTSKPFSINGCLGSNSTGNFSSTIQNETISLNKDSNNFEITHLFGFSYLWYSLIALFNVFFVGILLSFLTGFTKMNTLDAKLYINVFKVGHKRKNKENSSETELELENLNENKNKVKNDH